MQVSCLCPLKVQLPHQCRQCHHLDHSLSSVKIQFWVFFMTTFAFKLMFQISITWILSSLFSYSSWSIIAWSLAHSCSNLKLRLNFVAGMSRKHVKNGIVFQMFLIDTLSLWNVLLAPTLAANVVTLQPHRF